MLKVQIRKSSAEVYIALSGSIDEADQIPILISERAKKMRFDCSGVQQINSVGIKNWISFLWELQAAGTDLEFENVSFALVEQAVLMSGFFGTGKVLSVQLPYRCTSSACQNMFTISETVPTIRKRNGALVDGTCPKCRQLAKFDDWDEGFTDWIKTVKTTTTVPTAL